MGFRLQVRPSACRTPEPQLPSTQRCCSSPTILAPKFRTDGVSTSKRDYRLDSCEIAESLIEEPIWYRYVGQCPGILIGRQRRDTGPWSVFEDLSNASCRNPLHRN